MITPNAIMLCPSTPKAPPLHPLHLLTMIGLDIGHLAIVPCQTHYSDPILGLPFLLPTIMTGRGGAAPCPAAPAARSGSAMADLGAVQWLFP